MKQHDEPAHSESSLSISFWHGAELHSIKLDAPKQPVVAHSPRHKGDLYIVFRSTQICWRRIPVTSKKIKWASIVIPISPSPAKSRFLFSVHEITKLEATIKPKPRSSVRNFNNFLVSKFDSAMKTHRVIGLRIFRRRSINNSVIYSNTLSVVRIIRKLGSNFPPP